MASTLIRSVALFSLGARALATAAPKVAAAATPKVLSTAAKAALKEAPKTAAAKAKALAAAVKAKAQEATKKAKAKAKLLQTKLKEKEAAQKVKEKEAAQKVKEKAKAAALKLKIKEREQKLKVKARQQKLQAANALVVKRIPKSKPLVKAPPTPFMQFFMDQRASLLAAHPDAKTAELAKAAGAAWSAADAAVKAPYLERFQKLKAEHAQKVAAAQASLLRAPKRPLSGFLLFTAEHKAPEGVSITAHAQEMGRQWAALPPARKAPYEQQAAAGKLRYEAELQTFKSQLGTERAAQIEAMKEAVRSITAKKLFLKDGNDEANFDDTQADIYEKLAHDARKKAQRNFKAGAAALGVAI